MSTVVFELELLEPVLATQIEGDPNSAVSHRYVPGSMLRGALVGRYLAAISRDEPDDEGRRLFFDGTTRYLNAYPADAIGRRGLPVPRSWRRERAWSPGGDAFDLAVDLRPPLAHAAPVGELFCTVARSVPDDEYEETEDARPDAVLLDVPLIVSVHTSRDRAKGRATAEAGAVFRYEALPAGLRLAGAILCGSAEDAERIAGLLGDELSLGKSRSAGYGRVRVDDVQVLDSWAEAQGGGAVVAGAEVRLTLLSDAVMLDSDGAPADTVGPAELPDPFRTALRPARSFVERRAVGAFNRKWGLPTDQAYAVSAGSVFVFTAQADIPATAVRDLEARGVGERRVDGFGRVVVNWVAHAPQLGLRAPGERAAGTPAGTLDEESQSLARLMVARLLRRDLDRLVARYAQQLVDRTDVRLEPLQKAQLSRLREIVLDAVPTRDLKRVRDFLGGLRRNARQQYATARVGQMTFEQWLSTRLDHPEAVFGEMAAGDTIRWPALGGLEAAPDDLLAAEYTLRAIAGVAHLEARRRGKPSAMEVKGDA